MKQALPSHLSGFPRDNHEVDGSVRSTSSTDQLLSSPLSASNWAHRIVVPLSFLPIGASCPIGAKETQLVGQELVTDAIHQWQPSLCADSSYTYTFSQVADNTARRQLTAADPQLIFTSQPLPADQVDPTSPPVYAPVTLGALVFTYLVERQPTYNAPDSVQALAGTRVSTLKLSPRLVAKLLTESYRNSVNTPQSVPNYIAKNPQDIFADPEFIALNPEFKNYRIPYGAPDALVPIGITDAAAQLWKWMLSDKEARAFVDGTPDKWGMKVNEHYKGLAINTDSFPKADPYCATFGAAQQPLCTLDAHPYAADMHAAARAVSRGDTLSRSTWDPTATPPAWKPTDVEPQGRRAVIGFTTLSIADRYSLPTAQILNSGGSYVQADDASMLASYKSMTKDAATGMLLANPTSSDPAAYPLTTLTYAATRPAGLSADEAKAYASLLRYAAGAGQTPGIDVGQLPQGYLPLPASMRTQTNAVAATIETNAGKKTPVSTPSPTPAPTSTSGGVPSTTPTSVPTTQPTSTSPSTSQPAPVPSSSQPTITIVAARTPASPVGFARYGLVIVLVLGGLAACVGPALLGFGALRR